MRFLIFLTASLLLTQARAGTQVMFARDGSKVSVLMLAVGDNPDATRLFDTLNVAPEDMNGKMTKRIAFVDRDGVQAFDIVCAFSKVAPTGSCVSVLHRARDVVMNPSANAVSYRLQGEDARKIAAYFVLPAGSSAVYESADHHFTIKAGANSGTVDDFLIEYR